MTDKHFQQVNESPLEEMFDKFLEGRKYNMMETYLEMVKGTFSKYDDYRGRMYIAKQEDLTKSIVEDLE